MSHNIRHRSFRSWSVFVCLSALFSLCLPPPSDALVWIARPTSRPFKPPIKPPTSTNRQDSFPGKNILEGNTRLPSPEGTTKSGIFSAIVPNPAPRFTELPSSPLEQTKEQYRQKGLETTLQALGHRPSPSELKSSRIFEDLPLWPEK